MISFWTKYNICPGLSGLPPETSQRGYVSGARRFGTIQCCCGCRFDSGNAFLRNFYISFIAFNANEMPPQFFCNCPGSAGPKERIKHQVTWDWCWRARRGRAGLPVFVWSGLLSRWSLCVHCPLRLEEPNLIAFAGLRSAISSPGS